MMNAVRVRYVTTITDSAACDDSTDAVRAVSAYNSTVVNSRSLNVVCYNGEAKPLNAEAIVSM